MMTHRRTLFAWSQQRCRLVFALLLSSVLFGTAIRAIIASTHRSHVTLRINQQVWMQIEEGMSREQVVQLIGGPNGAYNKHPIGLKGQLSSWSHSICEHYSPEVWTGDNGEVIVCFDAKGFVRHSFYRKVFTCK